MGRRKKDWVDPRWILTPEQRKEIMTRYQAGELVSALAVEFGISQGCIHRMLNSNKIPHRSYLDVPLGKDWISKHKAAEMLGITVPALTHRVKMGYIKPCHTDYCSDGRVYRIYFDRADVDFMATKWRKPDRKRPEYTFEPSATDRAYLAAFMDGEGCINVQSHTNRSGYTQYYLSVAAYNTCPDVIDWIHDRFGGRVSRSEPYGRARHPLFTWRATSGEACAILKMVLPYLIIKKERASIAVELHEHIQSKHPGRGHPLTDEDMEWREAQKQRIADLNQRR